MHCLLIDTSGASLVLGAADDLGRVLAALEVEHSRDNSMRLRELAQEVLVSADITLQQLGLVCVGCGPGSFIGTRTGVAFANGIASLGIMVLGVGSMEAAAAIPTRNARQVIVVREARRDSVFAGAYKRIDGVLQAIGESEVSLKNIGDILVDAAKMSDDAQVQLVTDSEDVYEAASAAAGLRAAVVLKPGIADLRGLAVLAAERWNTATGAVDVRYLRSAV